MKDEKKVKETEEKGKEIKEEQLKNVAGGKYLEEQGNKDYLDVYKYTYVDENNGQ
ncbi:MAG: hypothetical protein KBT31_03805 [Firmicutes bacterium]|nr:hypothetical protein [Candidatus Colimorpha enterica]